MAYAIKDEKGQPVKHNGEDVFATDVFGAVKAVNKDDRSLVIVGSDETKDRDGDIIMVSGWEMENFIKNPVFLYAHNHSGVPIGSATKVIRRKNPARLEFHEKFPSEGIYPFADMILALFQEKVLNASSVGFMPKKWEEMEKDEDNPNQYWPGRRFTKQELLELSACAVPSNPAALQVNSLAKSIMSKSMNEIKEMMEPKDRDLILEQLANKSVEFEDETKAFFVQVTEDISKGEITSEVSVASTEEATTEEFVTVKGEFENKTIEENNDMEIKELLEKISESILTVSVKLDKLNDLEKLTGLVDGVAEIKSFITNLTKSDESDTHEEVDEKSVSKDNTEDLYKDALSQTDNKESEAENGGLSPEEEEVLKQVTLNLKSLMEEK